jgi:7-carboxy-7-deazaguanine synthase
LETSGAIDMSGVDARVVKVMDLKTPASGELTRNRFENIELLNRHDQVKFVICDRQDYEWARLQVEQLRLHERVADVLFSPSFGQQNAKELAEWILRDRVPVRFQLQLHKLLWDDAAGH